MSKEWFREIYSKSCQYAGFSYIEVHVAVFDIFNIVERYDYKDLKVEDIFNIVEGYDYKDLKFEETQENKHVKDCVRTSIKLPTNLKQLLTFILFNVA